LLCAGFNLTMKIPRTEGSNSCANSKRIGYLRVSCNKGSIVGQVIRGNIYYSLTSVTVSNA
jgi:hypothetical protein